MVARTKVAGKETSPEHHSNVPSTFRLRKPMFATPNGDTLAQTDAKHTLMSLSDDAAIRPPHAARRKSGSSIPSVDNDEEPSATSHSSADWGPRRLAAIPSRLMMLACTLLFTISLLGRAAPGIGVNAGSIRRWSLKEKDLEDGRLLPRQNTDTNICSRWSQQSAAINGTIYVYGGHATTTQGQTDNTWNNDFFTIDVTKSWDISAPVVSGLAQPSGPPNVSNGYLWNSFNSLYLYGGEFSDTPPATPPPFSLWEYDIGNSSWIEHQNPQTSAGNNSDPANQPVQRSAEGAGISVPELGRGFYFAGHVDQFTTPGWSNQIFRVYLKSLLEYTFPGYTNNGVQSLSGGEKAGSDGTWRNITQGGIQDTATFPNRADSALVYVPGYGAQGILVSMGGGTNVSFVRLLGNLI